MFSRPVMIALMSLALAGTQASAQSNVDVSADVPVASPMGGGVRNLVFGTIAITPGVTRTVSVPAAVTGQSGSAFSGEFMFGVGSSRGLDFTLSLPANLISTADGTPLSIDFNGTQYGAKCVTEGSTGCTLTPFNPSAMTTMKVCKAYSANGDCKASAPWSPGSELHVYVGAAITVPPTQVAATYAATVTLKITQVY